MKKSTIKNQIILYDSWTGKEKWTAYPDSVSFGEMLDISEKLWNKRNRNHKVVLKINGKIQQKYPAIL